MRRSHKLRLIAMLAVGATVAAAVSGLASAGKPEEKGRIFSETFHEESLETIPAKEGDPYFCGEDGLIVEFKVVTHGRAQVVLHGRDQLPYFAVHINETTTATNENGVSLVTTATFIDKDLRVTDNGDGTSTLLVLATGVSKLYGETGKVIAMDPGQIRVELLIDNNDTPSDPSDDSELDFLGVVKESTGRSDDYCEVAVPILFP